MADVKWIKIVTDIFDDEKILLIESLPSSDSIIVIWFKLLTLAGKQNNNGVFVMANRIPYTDEMLATIFRRDIGIVRLALKTFEQFGMIEVVENVITIPNWNKHQTLDAYEKRKERDRLYQAERRAKQKQLALKSSDASTDSSSDIVISEEDKEEDKIKIKKSNSRFTPPTPEEIKAYCIERQNNVDYERFYDFYSSKGWMVGKNKMKDWKAAVRTWEKGNKQTSNSTPKVTNRFNNFDQRDYTKQDYEDLEAKFMNMDYFKED